MMGYYGYDMGAFGWIGMILFWALLLLAIVWLWRALELGQSLKGRDEAAGKSKAPEIIRERYAKGEISKEEFEQLKRDLS